MTDDESDFSGCHSSSHYISIEAVIVGPGVVGEGASDRTSITLEEEWIIDSSEILQVSISLTSVAVLHVLTQLTTFSTLNAQQHIVQTKTQMCCLYCNFHMELLILLLWSINIIIIITCWCCVSHREQGLFSVVGMQPLWGAQLNSSELPYQTSP